MSNSSGESIRQQTVHIPKDAYAQPAFFECLDCCYNQFRTIRDVTDEMKNRVPERADYSGEHEVHRDRLDFGVYMDLVEKEEQNNVMVYQLTDAGRDLVDAHLRHEQYRQSRKKIQEHLLRYSTSNEDRARERYFGHRSHPFQVALKILHNLEKHPDHRQLLADGIDKTIFTNGVISVRHGTDEEITDAIEYITRMIPADEEKQSDIQDHFLREQYGGLSNYRQITTNHPARLGEWLVKPQMVWANSDHDLWDWPGDLSREARHIHQIYGLTEQGRDRIRRNDPDQPQSVQTRKTYQEEHESREESDEHKLVKLLVKEFPGDVLGEELEPVSEEYSFSTGDRVDLIMKDPTGRLVAIEAEVDIEHPEDRTGMLQAVKYKHMLEVERGKPFSSFRMMLVAFSIPDEQKQFAEETYGVEAYEIEDEYRDWIDLLTERGDSS